MRNRLRVREFRGRSAIHRDDAKARSRERLRGRIPDLLGRRGFGQRPHRRTGAAREVRGGAEGLQSVSGRPNGQFRGRTVGAGLPPSGAGHVASRRERPSSGAVSQSPSLHPPGRERGALLRCLQLRRICGRVRETHPPGLHQLRHLSLPVPRTSGMGLRPLLRERPHRRRRLPRFGSRLLVHSAGEPT